MDDPYVRLSIGLQNYLFQPRSEELAFVYIGAFLSLARNHWNVSSVKQKTSRGLDRLNGDFGTVSKPGRLREAFGLALYCQDAGVIIFAIEGALTTSMHATERSRVSPESQRCYRRHHGYVHRHRGVLKTLVAIAVTNQPHPITLQTSFCSFLSPGTIADFPVPSPQSASQSRSLSTIKSTAATRNGKGVKAGSATFQMWKIDINTKSARYDASILPLDLSFRILWIEATFASVVVYSLRYVRQPHL
ncbi:hypothetical protein DOTSEDRAFT_34007 [Dothistroma septosporum NZE10]|uniref:Uncharacterized protein n=1 Tax=Dothistroma septosporum (strain NZE10 / CBS 128990) TaxID=675120 RepID=N1PRF6_DOTSN|nr:hypothetical protein DOTSEDRAFT_34007 [Dothistroma septosporum NZE10]